MNILVIEKKTEKKLAYYKHIHYIPRVGDSIRIDNTAWHVMYVMWSFENDEERAVILVEHPVKCK